MLVCGRRQIIIHVQLAIAGGERVVDFHAAIFVAIFVGVVIAIAIAIAVDVAAATTATSAIGIL